MEHSLPITDWIHEARSGDQRALAKIYAHCLRGLTAYVERRIPAQARRWTDPGYFASDVLTQVLLGLRKEDSKIQNESDLRAHLRRLAKSRLFDLARNRACDVGESWLGKPLVDHKNPSSIFSVTRADRCRWLIDTLRSLRDDHQQVLDLCILQGLSFVEAGQRLDCPADTARKRYQVALQHLREKCAKSA